MVKRLSRESVCRRLNSEREETKCFKKGEAMTDMQASWSSSYKRKAFPVTRRVTKMLVTNLQGVET